MSASIAIQGTAGEQIRQLDTAEKCATYYVEHVEAYDAVNHVWRHVRDLLMLEGRAGKPIDAGAGRLVLVEPASYDVDLAVVKELAPECVKDVEQPQSESMKRIHELAGELLEEAMGVMHFNTSGIEEILRLSQPETVEQVDGRKLQSVLGRGDERARQLIDRKVKVANRWKLAVRTPESRPATVPSRLIDHNGVVLTPTEAGPRS
jgi:hypothetical protein